MSFKVQKDEIMPSVPNLEDSNLQQFLTDLTQKVVDLYRFSRDDTDTLDSNTDTISTSLSSLQSQVNGIIPIDVRQCVLYGQLDSSGRADFLDESSGQISIDADSTDLVLAFAREASDYIKRISSDVSPSAWNLSGESDDTYYLYVDYNSSADTLTYGWTTEAPDYGEAKPAAGTSGKHYFVIPEMTMYVDDGASWTACNRVFVGFVAIASGTGTPVCYALKGRYDSGRFAVTINTTYEKHHYIGCDQVDVYIDFTVAEAPSPTNGRICTYPQNGSDNDGYGCMYWIDYTDITIFTGDKYVAAIFSAQWGISSDATYDSGYYRIQASRRW